MKKPSTIVGLDVGTTKICAVVGDVLEGELEIRGVGTSVSTGLRKGVVSNIDTTVDSIKKAVRSAESITGEQIREVYLGITGAHIKAFNSYGAIRVKGKEVTSLDVERVIESARAVYVPLDREVIHVIPTGYILDGQDSIRDPAGMTGVRLEAKVQILTGSVSSLQNLLKCCEKAGLEVVEIIFEPLASALATLTEDEKELGVAVVDIGGGTTDIVLYQNGWLQYSTVLPVGGNHFTNDIAVGMRLSVNEAERLKKHFGCAAATMVSEEEMIDITQSGQGRKIPRRYLSEVIQPRAEELLELIKGELLSCSGYDVASSGIVLTGGGSLLDGLDRIAEAVLGLPVRIGYLEGIRGCRGTTNSPVYATGVGLVLYGLKAESRGYHDALSITGIFQRMKNWVNGIFK
ncbi:MAG: cell division protein FtsA [Nitrospira sp.]|nr:cell division protein FtsA [Nitrospira sp.]